jgi:hypothetical protein
MIEAVYTYTTRNFHVFQINHQNVTGTIYLPKEEDIQSHDLEFSLVTPNTDREGWRERMEELMLEAGDRRVNKLRASMSKFPKIEAAA